MLVGMTVSDLPYNRSLAELESLLSASIGPAISASTCARIANGDGPGGGCRVAVVSGCRWPLYFFGMEALQTAQSLHRMASFLEC